MTLNQCTIKGLNVANTGTRCLMWSLGQDEYVAHWGTVLALDEILDC